MPTVQVSPKEKNPTHHISLSDGIRTYGLILAGGPRGIQEVPATPSTLKFSGGGTKFGDWEPGFSHIEQRDWTGGRGQENFSEDATRFRDSQNCWTMTPERLTPGPQWEFGRRLVAEMLQLPSWPPDAATGVNNDVTWISLLGDGRYRAARFTFGATGLTADRAYLWVRRVGSPGTLTLELRTNSAGLPTITVLQTVTKTASDIVDTVSELVEFDWTGTQALSSATDYHVVIYGASTDTVANHWEVGADPVGLASYQSKSSDGITWDGTLAARLYFDIVAAYADRKYFLFEMDGASYAVDAQVDGAASFLYINGARGKATSATSTVLTDTNASLGTDTYKSAYIRIIRGTGVGQIRQITSHTATAVTTAAWDITPDSTSEYVIYDTRYWNVIATTGLTKPVTSVAVSNNIAYIAQGNAVNIRRIRFNPAAAPPAHEFADDGTNKADLLYTFYDAPSKAAQVWRAFNASTVQVSRAPSAAWGTDLVFGTGIAVGDTTSSITGLTDYDGNLYVFKQDSAWQVVSDTPEKLAVGLGTSPDENNGRAALSLGLFLYFSYMASVERLYGSTLDDVGPWRGTGLPSGRAGKIVSMTSAYAWLFAAIDAGASGYSSVMCYDGRGWHELFRASVAGKRIRTVYVQNNPGSRPKVWFEMGGVLAFFRLPLDTLRPLNDSTFPYQHEGVMITSIIDMGSANLPKFFDELSALTENLGGATEVRVDYQMDNDIGTTTFTPASHLLQSPEDSVQIGAGNKRQAIFRFRLLTDDADVPPIVRATVAKVFARTPVKYQYLLKIKVADQQSDLRGNRDADPDELMYWLKSAAAGARKITMRSLWEQMDNVRVVVEPPTLIRQFTDPILSWWGGVTTITLREA